MLLLCKAGFALAVAAITAISGGSCFDSSRLEQALTYRSFESSNDYLDIYSRDLFDDDFEEDYMFSIRDIENQDIDTLLAYLSRRQTQSQQAQPQPQPQLLPAPANTPQDIATLCAIPVPNASDFTSFFTRSGLPSNRALFWSGIKDSTAMSIGQKLGKVTLEMLVKPNNIPLPGCEKGQTGPQSQLWWNAASQGFGDWTTGGVSVVFSQKRYEEVKAGKSVSTWVKVEAPTLWQKIKAKAKAVVGDVKSAMDSAIAKIRQGFLGQQAAGTGQAQQPPAQAQTAAPLPLTSPQGNGLETIQMYICDSEGNNLSQPRPYDGPAPVSGNAATVQKPARR